MFAFLKDAATLTHHFHVKFNKFVPETKYPHLPLLLSSIVTRQLFMKKISEPKSTEVQGQDNYGFYGHAQIFP